MEGTLIHGYINLSQIPKELIVTNKKNEKILYIDVVERREPSQYGDTHAISVWGQKTGKVYIGAARVRDFSQRSSDQRINPQDAGTSTPVVNQNIDDLPF